MTKDIGIGIVGPGAIAEMHASALHGVGARIVAAAGPDPADLEAFADRFAVPNRYSHIDRLLEDPGVDAVIVSAPSAVHHALSVAAIEAGKPVLCEIPLALSYADGLDLVERSRERGVLLALAHTLRYWEPHRRLIEELGRMGITASQVVVRSLMLRQSDTGWTGKQRIWTDSVVWHHGSHAVDAALWFLGDVDVQSSIEVGPPWVNRQPMDAAARMRTADGRIATVNLSYHSRRPKVDFLVIAEDATFEITGGSLYRDGEAILEGEVADVQSAAIRRQDRAFVDAIRDGAADVYLAEQALPALRVLQGATAGAPGRSA